MSLAFTPRELEIANRFMTRHIALMIKLKIDKQDESHKDTYTKEVVMPNKIKKIIVNIYTIDEDHTDFDDDVDKDIIQYTCSIVLEEIETEKTLWLKRLVNRRFEISG